MRNNSKNEHSRPNDRLSEFKWTVYRGGYRWLHVGDAGHGREPGPYVLSSAVDEGIEKRDSEFYEPSKDEPGLFRRFASIAPNRKSILDFANRYGRLGGTVESEEEWEITLTPELLRKVERFRSWVLEILFMRAVVDLWVAVQARDERTIKKHIHWHKQSASFQSGHNAGTLRLPAPPMPEAERDPSSPLPWSTELDDEFRSLKILGWVAHPRRDDSKVIDYLQSDWNEAALHFLEVVVNRKLIEHSIERPRLQWVRPGQLAWQHVPSSLIGLLWLQFADAIVTNRIFKQCAQCNKWFETTQNAARTDKLYCSQTCRVRAYRTRQAEARELYSLGSTVSELAERFSSDPKTIKAWLGKGETVK